MTDTATVTGVGRRRPGPVTFFLCQPATVTANGGNCHTGGSQVGAPKSLDGRLGDLGRVDEHDDGRHLLLAGRVRGRRQLQPLERARGHQRVLHGHDAGGGGPITFQARGSFQRFGTSDSQPVTVPAGANRILVFVFAGKFGGDTLSSVTYGGVPLTLAGRARPAQRASRDPLPDQPAAGHGAACLDEDRRQPERHLGLHIYSGVNQATPFGSAAQTGVTRTIRPAARA